MKEQLLIIQGLIGNIFDYNNDSLVQYKKNLRIALQLLKDSPASSNVSLEHWKVLAIEEFEKELNNRFSEKFEKLPIEDQRSEFKYSKINTSNLLMNVLMNL